MPAMFSSISYISTSIQQSAAEDPLHLSYEDMDEEEDEDIADDKSDSSWTNGKDIFYIADNKSDSSWTNGKDIFYPVLRIRDILVRIRIRGFVPLTNGSGAGSGSGSCYFRQ
jgi:hypothetical protein